MAGEKKKTRLHNIGSIFFLQIQTALNQQPCGERSMPAPNNRLSAILLKLNPAQIPYQKH